VPIDLTQVALQQVASGNNLEGVAFSFADSSVLELPAGGRVVIVDNLAAFRARYGPQPLVAGEWNGQLSNGSERLQMVAGDQLLVDFAYDDEWYPVTDGGGNSLQVAEESGDVALWNNSAGWRPSSRVGGTPGARDGRIPGDSNGDGRFNTGDLVLIFQAGKYEDALGNNTSFEEGDWNGDGDFTSSDLVYAFQTGGFVAEARPREIVDRAIASLFHDADDAENADGRRDGQAGASLQAAAESVSLDSLNSWPNRPTRRAYIA
jgi:hypothetical protein